MVVVLHDRPFGPEFVSDWVHQQLINLGLDPDGVDNAQVWACTIVRPDTDGWLVEYRPMDAIVEHTDPFSGVHTTLYSCPFCTRLTDRGMCPHCGVDIINDHGPDAEFQTPEDVADWFTAGMGGDVEFRCDACGELFSVEAAINHALQLEHTKFHRT
jgi:hypothetical protein